MEQQRQIYVLTTGGTIEKSYCESAGELGNFRSLLEDQILSALRLPKLIISIKEVIAKDSLHMTKEDREQIWLQIQQVMEGGEGPIIVLHGTDTVDATMKYVRSQCQNPLVPVLFTGAMKPVDILGSDAIQNFTEAVMASQLLRPGWYLSFHGQIFRNNEFKKDRKNATFLIAGE